MVLIILPYNPLTFRYIALLLGGCTSGSTSLTSFHLLSLQYDGSDAAANDTTTSTLGVCLARNGSSSFFCSSDRKALLNAFTLIQQEKDLVELGFWIMDQVTMPYLMYELFPTFWPRSGPAPKILLVQRTNMNPRS
jgi:hypothetical protein